MRDIGKRLRDLRKKRGYTLEELAEQLYCSSSALCNFEKGTSVPKIDVLLQIAEHYGVTLDEIIGTDARVLHSLKKFEMSDEAIVRRLQLDGKPFTETEWYWFVGMVRAYRQMKAGSRCD